MARAGWNPAPTQVVFAGWVEPGPYTVGVGAAFQAARPYRIRRIGISVSWIREPSAAESS